MWCFGRVLARDLFIAGDRNPAKLVQITKSKHKIKKPAGYLTCTPVDVEPPLHATGFGSLPNQSGAFSVFQWLCGLSFSYTYHKPTCHKTGPIDTPTSIGLDWFKP